MMYKKQFIIKGFPYNLLEDMLSNPSKPNRLHKTDTVTFSGTKQYRVFFVDSYDYMVYSLDVLNNELLSASLDNNYLSNPQDESSEIFCVNRTLEHMLPH